MARGGLFFSNLSLNLDHSVRGLTANSGCTTQMASVLRKRRKPKPFFIFLIAVFDKQKLARLKRIAKIEKAYLKDIIGDLVSEFIDSYEVGQKTINPEH